MAHPLPTTAHPLPNKMTPRVHPRLLDALTVRHGPAPLLARFILAGDRALRDMGLTLRIRTDFEALIDLNKQQVAAGNWLPVPDAYNPEIADLDETNGFWIAGENAQGEIVVTWASRIHDWTGTTMAERMRTAWYGRDTGQPCVVTAEAATMITGICACSGASWVRPDLRGKHLSHLMPRIGKAYASSHWPLDWAVGFIGLNNVAKGLANSYGQKNLSRSVIFPGSAWGEVAVVYTSIADVYADLSDYLGRELFEVGDVGMEEDFASLSFTQDVTNNSSDGVFQGSSSRS